MITEDYCSFEVSKLLKQKGFVNDWCIKYYEIPIHDYGSHPLKDSDSLPRNYNFGDFYCSAPTLQMAMKWLREVHNLHIDVFIGITENDSYTYWTYFIVDLKGNMIVNAYGEDINFKGESCEQTIEAAIKYCLITLI